MTLTNTATANTMTLGSGGFNYNGSSVDYTRLNALRAICPSVNPTILGVNKTISLQNNDVLGSSTRVIQLSSGDTAVVGEHFGIQWEGDTLPFVMETLDATPLQVKDTQLNLTSSTTGGFANPQLTLTNTNTGNNSVALEIYKNRTTGVSNGDTLFQQSVYGKDSGNTKQEYTRITHTIRDITAGAEDGSIEMGCLVNGAFANFLQLN
jgi:hypothetical protein